VLDALLYVALPYAAVAVALAGTVMRLRGSRVGISALPSQFLESHALRWVSPPWHVGIFGVLALHLVILAVPGPWQRLVARPWGLFTVEALGLALAVIALVGLVLAAWRRLFVPRVRAVSTGVDLLLLAGVGGQVGLGIGGGVIDRWGAAWATATVVPYLRSVLVLNPDPTLVTDLPVLLRLHLVGAWLLVALLPFSRLVHALFFPLAWLWREPQVVIFSQTERPRSGDSQ